MKRWRLLLMPFMAVAELAVIAACWALAVVGALKTSTRLMDWATDRFPSIYWYIGE